MFVGHRVALKLKFFYWICILCFCVVSCYKLWNEAETSYITYTLISNSKTLDISWLNFKHVTSRKRFSTCHSWRQPDKWKNEKPEILLDPDRFLYPGLIWGPNNQIVGLWQAVYLSIRLNRTLVIPKFHSHFTNGFQVLPAFQMIDLNKLCSFVSCIPIEHMRTSCNDSFDVVFQGKPERIKSIKMFEKNTKMKILRISTPSYNIRGATNIRFYGNENIPNNIPALPSNEYKMHYRHEWISSETATLRRAFGTQAQCALFASPFRTIALKTNQSFPLPLSTENINDVTDDRVAAAVVNAVQRPMCIKEAAETYISDVFHGKLLVGVHWRFDKFTDFGKRCITHFRKIKESTRSTCKSAFEINEPDLARAISKYISSLQHNSTVWTTYIATPPSLKSFRKKTYNKLISLNPNFKKPAIDLQSYLLKNFKYCWLKYKWLSQDEILSLVEMEIMRFSFVFFYSPHSSWSSNIIPLRTSTRHGCEKSNTTRVNVSLLKLAIQEKNIRKEKLELNF